MTNDGVDEYGSSASVVIGDVERRGRVMCVLRAMKCVLLCVFMCVDVCIIGVVDVFIVCVVNVSICEICTVVAAVGVASV